MMGANWQIGPRCTVTNKFAWWPVRTEGGKLVWCRQYVNIRQSVSGPGTDAVWNERYTLHEYFIKKLSE